MNTDFNCKEQVLIKVAKNEPHRILRAIQECDSYINKQNARSADLRPVAVQQHIDYCIAHKAKLNAILEASK